MRKIRPINNNVLSLYRRLSPAEVPDIRRCAAGSLGPQVILSCRGGQRIRPASDRHTWLRGIGSVRPASAGHDRTSRRSRGEFFSPLRWRDLYPQLCLLLIDEFKRCSEIVVPPVTSPVSSGYHFRGRTDLVVEAGDGVLDVSSGVHLAS